MIDSIHALTGALPTTPTVQPSGGATGDPGAFGSELAEAIDRVDAVAETADTDLAKLAAGEEVDLHGTMIELEKADIALRTLVSVRDKAIGAYEAIMNMAI